MGAAAQPPSLLLPNLPPIHTDLVSDPVLLHPCRNFFWSKMIWQMHHRMCGWILSWVEARMGWGQSELSCKQRGSHCIPEHISRVKCRAKGVKDGRSQPPPVPIGRWPILHGDPYNHGSTEGGEYAVPPLLLGMLGIYFQMPPFGWAFPEGMKQLRKVLCSILSYLRSSNSVQNRKNIGTKVFWCWI